MHAGALLTPFYDERLRPTRDVEHRPDVAVKVTPDLRSGDLLVGTHQVSGVCKQQRVEVLFGADRHIDVLEQGPGGDALSPNVVPRVRPEVQVEVDGAAVLPGTFGCQEGGAARRFAGQAGAGHLEGCRAVQRRGQHVIDVQLEVRGVVPVEDEREPVRRLDAQQHGAAAGVRLAGHEAGVDLLTFQERQDEIADLVIPYGRQQAGAQAEAAGADRDVERAAADQGSEAADLLELCTDVVGVQVDTGSAHRDEIEAGAHGGTSLPFRSRPVQASRVKWKLAPSPSALSAQMRPPWRLMMRNTVARPMPEPLNSSPCSRWNGTNSLVA